MTKLVTIFGGSGFVGRYIARRMAKAGWRVRVAVRRPNEAILLNPTAQLVRSNQSAATSGMMRRLLRRYQGQMPSLTVSAS